MALESVPMIRSMPLEKSAVEPALPFRPAAPGPPPAGPLLRTAVAEELADEDTEDTDDGDPPTLRRAAPQPLEG